MGERVWVKLPPICVVGSSDCNHNTFLQTIWVPKNLFVIVSNSCTAGFSVKKRVLGAEPLNAFLREGGGGDSRNSPLRIRIFWRRACSIFEIIVFAIVRVWIRRQTNIFVMCTHAFQNDLFRHNGMGIKDCDVRLGNLPSWFQRQNSEFVIPGTWNNRNGVGEHNSY